MQTRTFSELSALCGYSLINTGTQGFRTLPLSGHLPTNK